MGFPALSNMLDCSSFLIFISYCSCSLELLSLLWNSVFHFGIEIWQGGCYAPVFWDLLVFSVCRRRRYLRKTSTFHQNEDSISYIGNNFKQHTRQIKDPSLLHQFKFPIRRYKADCLLWVKPRQIYTLMKSNIIKLNCFTTAK